jgi:hypothetical protein
LVEILLNAKEDFFPLNVHSMIMVKPMEHVWFIAHGVFCSLVKCSMMGGCLMIGLLTLIKQKMKSFQISEEKVYIWVVE